MRCGVFFALAILLGPSARGQSPQVNRTLPDQFEIGRRTFWDFGPPFNYYDIFIVRPTNEGASVERIIVTPPADECFAPAKVEITSAAIRSTPADLLGPMDPCEIPEKVLRRKPKNCKNCARFSGADEVMRVRCGTQTRIIRAHIFEDYWFKPGAGVPKTPFSLMELVNRMDQAVGPGVMDKPMITLPEEGNSSSNDDSAALQGLNAGKYDELFEGAKDKVSDLYRAAQTHPLAPSVRLVESIPFTPDSPILPKYPPIARAARVEGQVKFTATIDSLGTPNLVTLEGGNPLLKLGVRETIESWKFPEDATNHEIHGTIEFLLNCHVHRP